MSCSGSGANNGDAKNADGVFFINSKTKFRDITDGTSNTLFFSETLIGDGSTPPAAGPIDPQKTYMQLSSGTFSEAACAAAPPSTFKTKRNSFWADGDYNNGLFNAYYIPNDGRPDCVQHNNPGFKGARSRHTGGVNAALGDGSVRFISENVSTIIWRAIASRSGEEVATEF